MRGNQNFNFTLGQKVNCNNLHGYEGEILKKNRIYTVSFVGVNVIGLEEHSKEDGSPIKFFKHHFQAYKENVKRIFRTGDSIRYNGCNWTVIYQLGINLFLSYNGGGADDVCINILTDTYIVTKQKIRNKDKVTLVPLSSIQKFLDTDEDRYYLNESSMDKDTLHAIYMDLENIDNHTVSKACERKRTVLLKKYKDIAIPFELLIPLKEHSKYNPIVVGSKVIYKKGKFATINKEYLVTDIVKLSSKTLLGLGVDNGVIYVNEKQCKNTKSKDEKKVVKKEFKDIF
jgi:hypothetical protein